MKEREISLLDLCVEMLLKWRVVLLAMVIGGVLLGAFSYVNSWRAARNWSAVKNDPKEQEKREEQLNALKGQLKTLAEHLEALENRRELIEGWKQEAEEDIDAWAEENLTERQFANIDTALLYEETYETRRIYQESSIYMNMDPNSVAHGELAFLVNAGSPEETNRVVQIYEDLTSAGALYERLGEELGVSPESLQEIVGLERTAYGQSIPVNTLRLFVRYGDEEGCEKILQAIEAYFAEEQRLLEGEIGPHSIDVLSRSVLTRVDAAVGREQIDLKTEQMNRAAAIANIKDAFSDEETFYYTYLTDGDFSKMMELELIIEEKAAETAETAEGEEPSEEESVPPAVGVSAKYILLGMILAAFVYAFFLFVKYIMDARLRYTDDVQELYEIPALGRIPVDRKKKPFDFVDRWIYALRDRNRRGFSKKEAILLSAAGAKIAARKKGVGTVCCLGCGLRDNSLGVCEQIKAQLEEDGLKVSILNNVLYDAEALEQLSSVGSVVLVETAGVTLYEEVLKELELLKRQEIEVLGCVVVEG